MLEEDLSSYKRYLMNMETVSALNNLTNMDLSNRIIDNPSALAILINLEILQMRNCVVKDKVTNRLTRFIDFSFLENLVNLKVLNVEGCFWVSSHSALSKLKKLETLSANLIYKRQHIENLQVNRGEQLSDGNDMVERRDVVPSNLLVDIVDKQDEYLPIKSV